MIIELVNSDGFFHGSLILFGGTVVGGLAYAIYNTKLDWIKMTLQTYMAEKNKEIEELKTDCDDLKKYADGICAELEETKEALKKAEEKADDLKSLVEKNKK